MTTAVVPAQGTTIQGQVITPTAMATAAQSANHGLAQVLKELVAAAPHAFRSENEVLAAHKAIDNFVKATVPASNRAALEDGTQRAPVEDVSMRPAPAGSSYAIPGGAPQLDYDKLARAMVRAQLDLAAENSVPATTLVTSAPATDNTESATNGTITG